MTPFKNPKLPNLFPEFSDCEYLELGDSIGEMNHDEACKHRIPTKDETHYLIACGSLKQGDIDFWSSSVFSFFRDYAWTFNGYYGSVNNHTRYDPYGVRCVGRPCATPAGPPAGESKRSSRVEPTNKTMITFHIHANIHSDGVHVLCPPRLIKEVVGMLEKVPGVELSLFESTVRELLRKTPDDTRVEYHLHTCHDQKDCIDEIKRLRAELARYKTPNLDNIEVKQ